MEFCAGLIDKGEDPLAAAARELKEETGYIAASMKKVTHFPLAYEPGLSCSCFSMIQLEIDGDAPENVNACQELDEGEDISVHFVSLPESATDRSLVEQLHQLAEQFAPRVVIEAKLMAFASGLDLARSLL